MLQGSLLLVGALVFFINSLHSRPDDGSYARKLCGAIFPLTHDAGSPDLIVRTRNRDEGEGIPYAIGSVMYLRDILLKPTASTYRFSEVKLIPEDVFNYAIGCLPDDVTRCLFKTSILKHARLAGYVPQRKGFTKRRAAREEEDLERQFPELEGAVVEVHAETAEGNQAPPEEIAVDGLLESILQQYASDIMQKCGNARGNHQLASFCPLVQYERQHISFDDINTLDLTRLFSQVQWRRGTPEEWDGAFDRLFPPRSHIDAVSTAHFHGCCYYTKYREFQIKLNEEQCDEVRGMLHGKVNELAWIPATKSDRLWDYSEGDRSWKKVPIPNMRGPRILVNPVSGGQVNITNDPHDDARVLEQLEEEAEQARNIALREEEEEDSDDALVPAAAALSQEAPSRSRNESRPSRGHAGPSRQEAPSRSSRPSRGHTGPSRLDYPSSFTNTNNRGRQLVQTSRSNNQSNAVAGPSNTNNNRSRQLSWEPPARVQDDMDRQGDIYE